MSIYRWQIESGWGAKRFTWHRRLILLGILALLIAIIIYGGIGRAWLVQAGKYLVLDHSRSCGSEAADFGIVLAGEFPNRVLESYELYREGKIRKIVLSLQVESIGFDVARRRGIELADQQTSNFNVLAELGVPERDIIRLRQPSPNTIAEANVFKFWLSNHSGTKVVIITSKSHSRRAFYTFRDGLGESSEHLDLKVIPSRFDDFAPTQWWTNPVHLREVILEYQKLLSRRFRKVPGYSQSGKQTMSSTRLRAAPPFNTSTC